jgi:hypothetical protein
MLFVLIHGKDDVADKRRTKSVVINDDAGLIIRIAPANGDVWSSLR